MPRLLTAFASALALIAAAAAPVGAQAPTLAAAPAKAEPLRYSLSAGRVTLEVVDLSPRFLAFYEAAKNEPDAEKRYALWKQHYGFAAVPPGPRGEAMAKELLAKGWPRYAAALDTFRAGARGMPIKPLDVAARVAAVLKPDGPVRIRFVAYVGAFEDNAFAYSADGVPVVNVPIEIDPASGEVTVAHEMTHAFHMAVGRLSGGWERSIAATMLQEGLAIHVSREVVPGRPMASYIEYQAGWLARAEANRRAILAGLRGSLAARDGETVFKFTIGEGSTGLEREAYYGGWAVVQHLRDQGMTLAQIARIPEDEMPTVVGRAIDEMLGG